MLVTTGSITTAARLARAVGRDAGVSARVVQTPPEIKKGGCSYAVRFDEGAEWDIRAAVQKYRLPVKKFYREGLSGGRRTYHAVP